MSIDVLTISKDIQVEYGRLLSISQYYSKFLVMKPVNNEFNLRVTIKMTIVTKSDRAVVEWLTSSPFRIFSAHTTYIELTNVHGAL
ncbi:hypothetical protein RRG08_015611 [Elysia crispata]|uniref:Uncharacterized protein n=1 Tax=Elysia crispata TaxID=231223 RepID=A0AAE0YHB5_9GAST|nr:hypothetical protein RRG08_015611 [Elysia crispata]